MKTRNIALLLVTMPAMAVAQGDTAKAPPKPVPFDWADWTWLNGNARTKDSPLDTKMFTGEFRLDATYLYDFNNPQDHVRGIERIGTDTGIPGAAAQRRR
jgi:hypothetical protein